MNQQGYWLHLSNVDAGTWRATSSRDAMISATGSVRTRPGITSRGAYYETGAKIGIAIGAVLIAGGIFTYIEGRKKAASG